MGASERSETIVDADGVAVRLTHPDRVVFAASGWRKADVAEHFLACDEGTLRGVYDRPVILKRWNRGVDHEPFYQKRAPKSSDHHYTTVRFPSGRAADLLTPRHIADVVWMVQLNCLDLHPWPVRSTHLDAPDELRVDLDPTEGFDFADVRRVALVVRDLLAEHGLVGWPKTSGSRGLHVLCRIEPAWSFTAVRRAALALARAAERTLPDAATSAWWKEERRGVFVDYNQNARDRTVASAYSVRHTGLVSAPLTWEEVEAGAEPDDFPVERFAERYARLGDPHAGIDDAAGRLDGLLELARRDEQEGLHDAPWPPHFPKADDEPRRVQPSRRRNDS